ncbi:hypothetical protein [Stenotrophomonas maltophilia]|uniref:hypothetical protein n=1 Tax=Stenotrophomonas maltophilia TaxID=40324 RepID=UPI002E79EBE8|nr:hypothetical protein [Stenotrophomonas maltophilia]
MIRVVRSANRVRRPQRHDVQAFHAGTSTHQSPPVRAIGANQILDGALPCQRGVVAYLVQDVHAPVGAAQCKQIHLGVAPAAQFYGQRISVAHLRNLVAARISKHQQAEQARLNAEREKIRKKEEARAQKAAADAAAEAAAQQQPEPVAVAPAANAAPVRTAPKVVVSAPEPNAAPREVVEINLGQVVDLIAPVKIDGEGLRQLGFEPVSAERGSKLYDAEQVDAMRAAMICSLQRPLPGINAQVA